MSERVREIMSEVLEIPTNRINESASQETLDDWTSLVHLRLITELESAFDVRVSMDEALSLNSYARIVEFLNGKDVSA